MWKNLDENIITFHDSILIVFLSIISITIRSWLIWNPNMTVFDEIYFGNFTNSYITKETFYDIHPPFAKLLLAGLARFSGYKGDISFINSTHLPYNSDYYVQLRIIVCIFSSFCPPIIYLIMRIMNISFLSSLVSSMCIALDTSLIIEGRLILTDGILHFFCCLHVLCLVYVLSLPKRTKMKYYYILLGITLGMACSIKNTAWGLIALDGVSILIRDIYGIGFNQFSSLIFSVFYSFFAIFIFNLVVHLSTYYIHFIVLDYTGRGSSQYHPVIGKTLIKKRLSNVSYWGVRVMDPPLIQRVLSIAISMFAGNNKITSFHNSESRPINWPLMTGRIVSFWGNSQDIEINCAGNIFVYYISFFSVVISLIIWARNTKEYNLGLPILGWFFSYVPFYLVPRVMYLYHYCIPLIFGCMCIGSLLNTVSPKLRGILSVFIIFFATIGFVFLNPWVYGTTQWDTEITKSYRPWFDGDIVFKQRMNESFKKTKRIEAIHIDD